MKIEMTENQKVQAVALTVVTAAIVYSTYSAWKLEREVQRAVQEMDNSKSVLVFDTKTNSFFLTEQE